MDDSVVTVAEQLLDHTRAFVREERLPGASVGVVTRAGLGWTGAAGFADLVKARRPDADTLYRIASNTKVFTAIGVLQLRDEGRLRLDDPLVVHLPEFAAVTNPFGPIEDVTIRRLLTHESGLQGEHPFTDPTRPAELRREQVLAALDRVRVAIPPSSAGKYSNIGFDLLGEVVARLNGGDYEEVLQRRVLRPLGMTATTCHPTGDLEKRCAVGHDARDHSDVLRPARVLDPDLMPGCGMLWSTVADLARFLAFAMAADRWSDVSHPVLAPRSLAEMQDCRILTGDSPPVFQGLAWYSEAAPDGSQWLGHAGGVPGFVSRTLFRPDDGLGVIVLLNGIADAGKLAMELATLSAGALRGRPEPEPSTPPAAPPVEVERLLGAYQDDDDSSSIVHVEWRDGQLTLVGERDADVLVATGDTSVWTVRSGRPAGETARFLTDDRGVVTALNVAGYPYRRLRAERA
ncbi:MAG: serine hydrolase domain-containing protein [Thermoleophilia bacterium]|jgi:CubicO group peptidase (beta-lactamase class C family)|nr:serine hydrolase domain-containing protein [Thermoleophilia bacterium]